MANESPIDQPSPGEAATSDVVEPLWKKVLNDRFTILEPIGMGGMGKVYKAIQAPLDRIVAIKVLKSEGGVDPGFRQRFFLEASLTSKLRHPNTVTVIDYGETPDGIFYLAMEYLDGQPLSQIIAKSGSFHWTRCIQIGQQICRSLREAHKLGIVHRDLKPGNVMLLTEDRDQDLVKILDFGLVKSFIRETKGGESEITNPGIFLGSPQYMAPEQLRNQADPRSDVYSLGVVLYEMLMGRPPFAAKDSIDVMFKHMNEPAPPMRSVRQDIEVPREVEALVMKCLEKQPSWRFQSMDDVLEAMRKAATSAGAVGIVADSAAAQSDHASAEVTAAPESPTLAEQLPEGAFAIDIDVLPPSEPEAIRHARSLLEDRRVRAALPVAFFGIGLVIVLIIFAFHRTNSQRAQLPSVEQTKAPPQNASVVVKTEEPAADLNAKPAAKTVAFKISSDPVGARVLLNGRSVGYTPLSVYVSAGPDGTASAELLFFLKGYQPLTVTTGGSGPELVITQKLQPLHAQRSIAEPRRREPARAREPAVETKPAEPEPQLSRRSSAEEEPKTVASVQPPRPEEPSREPLTAPPPPPPPQNTVLPYGEGMTQPQQLAGKPIVYTREAQEAGVQGTMTAKCVITLRGTLENCRINKSLPYMEKAVLDALATRRYKPILLQGKPVAVEYVFNIKLVLQEKRCIGSRGCPDGRDGD